MIRSSLIDASMSVHFLLHTIFTVVYTVNRSPIALLQSPSPFETLFPRPPNYGLVESFGCFCFSLFVPGSTNVFQPRATQVFSGAMPLMIKGIVVLIQQMKIRIFKDCDVDIEE